MTPHLPLKHTLRLFALALVASLFAACDEVDDKERFIYVALNTPGTLHNVLIEDFTGQRCSNCPAAAKEIAQMQRIYGEERIIPVAIHGGPMAVNPGGKVVGLRNALADEYYAAAGVTQNPQGVIDKMGGVKETNQWLAAVISRMDYTAPLDLKLTATHELTDDADLVRIQLTATGVERPVSGRLQLWVLESGITALQLVGQDDGKTVVNDAAYVHDHVLRAAVNGTWGEDFSLAVGEERTLPYSIPVASTWRADNLSIVAFVYDDEHGVEQVVQAHVALPSDDNTTPESPTL